MICELEIILHIMNFQGMDSLIKTHPVLKKHRYLENFTFLAENNYRIEICDKFCMDGMYLEKYLKKNDILHFLRF